MSRYTVIRYYRGVNSHGIDTVGFPSSRYIAHGILFIYMRMWCATPLARVATADTDETKHFTSHPHSVHSCRLKRLFLPVCWQKTDHILYSIGCRLGIVQPASPLNKEKVVLALHCLYICTFAKSWRSFSEVRRCCTKVQIYKVSPRRRVVHL